MTTVTECALSAAAIDSAVDALRSEELGKPYRRMHHAQTGSATLHGATWMRRATVPLDAPALSLELVVSAFPTLRSEDHWGVDAFVTVLWNVTPYEREIVASSRSHGTPLTQSAAMSTLESWTAESAMPPVPHEYVSRALHSLGRVRGCDRLDISTDNDAAREALATDRWWHLSPDSPETVLALSLHPNP